MVRARTNGFIYQDDRTARLGCMTANYLLDYCNYGSDAACRWRESCVLTGDEGGGGWRGGWGWGVGYGFVRGGWGPL